MSTGNTTHEAKRDSFESVLIRYVAQQSRFANSYDNLATFLSAASGKSINGRKITFMARGEAYAKKWLMDLLLKTALQFGWAPSSAEDWEDVIWALTGKRQSVYGGDNQQIYVDLAELSGKPEQLFESNFQEMLQETNYGRSV
ncbi:hypothetical protein [Alteromonas macleodii]|uniref:Uncharacterized protein n=1 Tax=Alteromonas macleodii TaxID=28108 RepID=A0AB36FQY0_ALTMA|nr:hypothetical protein [Alteromonas macleodii]OES24459.1 hypothetical protein BFV95_4726 [Alteromonas macleodii]OES25516.1 hypothetical protein BFV94_4369 [Alteromonas macleodii]OES25819.1 hypothetical protein BFV93_4282 [Alteromonas macleodii]OES38662.1 hypothetical protein BFV96_4773 [Alteromonas macleodii]